MNEHSLSSTYSNTTPQRERKFAFIGGKQISRIGIKSYKGYVDKLDSLPDNAYIKENSILVQNILTNNYIVAMLPLQTKNIYLLDTINQLTFKNIDARLVWALLNSQLMNWYLFRFIFANAKITMHFDSPVSNKIPIPKIIESNQHIADSIIALVDEILALNSCHHKGFIPKNLTNTESQDSKNKDSFSLSQKEKGFIPSTLPLAPKRIKPPLFLFGNQGESLAISASSSKSAEALLPPLIRFYAPRNGREDSQGDLESPSSEVYLHCDKNQSHEVPTLKALSGQGINKGEGATSPNSSPSPLLKKESQEDIKTQQSAILAQEMIQKLQSQIDNLVYALYGLSQEEIAIVESTTQNAKTHNATGGVQ